MVKYFTKKHNFLRFLEIGIFGYALSDDVIKSFKRPYLSQKLMFFESFLLYL